MLLGIPVVTRTRVLCIRERIVDSENFTQGWEGGIVSWSVKEKKGRAKEEMEENLNA